MEKYDKQAVEGMLRNYTTLENTSDANFLSYKLDLDKALQKLLKEYKNLYYAVVGVFVLGSSIQDQADSQNVSKRQTIRRLDDGIHMLTMIMNGDI
jgi:CRISPR/Cas system-associated endonuclease Cas3-HD